MTNRIALACGIVLLASPFASVHAADLIIEQPAAAVASPSAFDWTGAYAGIHGGLAWGELDEIQDIDGQLAGVQAGYNVQIDNFVLGIEGDLSWSNLGFEDVNLPEWDVHYTAEWLASLRARAGIAADKVLFYGTAGVAFAGTTYDVFDEDEGIDGKDSVTHVGWVAGGGIEAMVADNISLKAEYLYRDLGEATYHIDGESGDIELKASTVTIGLNFHF